METPEVILSVEHLISSSVAKRAARNATALVLSSILTNGLLFIWQLVLARSLGVEGYGIYGTIGALMVIGASLPEFGMGLIVIRDVAIRPQDAGRYLAATLILQPLLAVVGYVVVMSAAVLLRYDSALRGLLSLAAVSLLVNTLGNMVHNQLIAVEQMVIATVIVIGHTIVLIILGAATLAAGGGLWGLYKMILVAGSLRVLAYWIVLLRMGVRPIFPPPYAIMRTLLINGAPFALSAFLSLAYIYSDKLLAAAIIGVEATGELVAGFVIVFGVIELLSTPLLVAVFPLMSRVHSSDHHDVFNSMLEKLSFFNMLLSLPIAIYTSFLAVPLSVLIFGIRFAGTAAALRIMIWYSVVAMVVNVFSQALAVQNRQRWLLLVRAIGLVLCIVLNLFLLPHLGISGTALAMTITETVVLLLILRLLDLPVNWWRKMLAHMWRLSLACLALATTTLLLRPVNLLLAVLVGLPTFAGLLFISGAVTEADRALIYQLAAALPGGAWMVRYWKR